ncbi:MAG: hypothetical protein M1814_002969 [Vezdaea aestivalis]|nr:MAG: hypothetical protein M1814_002969 [Vezdaea aestivalis]
MTHARNVHTLSNFLTDSEADELDDMVMVAVEKPAPRRRAPASKPVAKPPPSKPVQRPRSRKPKQEREVVQVPEPEPAPVRELQAQDEYDFELSQAQQCNKVLQAQIQEVEENFRTLENEAAHHSKVATELIESLKTEVAETQKENRSLSNKLTIARSVKAEAADSRTNVRPIAAGSVEAAHLATLKEDLYRDLTGLILRSIKREEETEVYDCLQTGRNGTLHFKLAIETTDGNSYDDAECHYTPLLDQDRDGDLIELLPDYLTEEITFPRERAAMFYSRIVQTLSKQGD